LQTITTAKRPNQERSALCLPWHNLHCAHSTLFSPGSSGNCPPRSWPLREVQWEWRTAVLPGQDRGTKHPPLLTSRFLSLCTVLGHRRVTHSRNTFFQHFRWYALDP